MSHPYKRIEPYRRWDQGIAQIPPAEVDPVVSFGLRVSPEQRIVTAGSCFAQHIARYLKAEGFNYLVTEPGHPLLNDELRAVYNYGVFSARFGNIYTSRQLEQLFRRAYGTFAPRDSIWPAAGDGFVDPFRPTIQPNGFRTPEELEADRAQHLRAVRRAFEQLDVFVFTFGLTECWAAASDGAVFPLAPGVAGGVFDSERYAFVNLGVDDVVSDMSSFIASLRTVNPAAKVILTVSPVPLMATGVDRHVLVSTTYSKSVLRVAAEMLVNRLQDVYYFPSYEIVMGNFSRGAYFADDLRSIRESGVEHVMSLFFRHATTAGGLTATGRALASAAAEASRPRRLRSKRTKSRLAAEAESRDTDARPADNADKRIEDAVAVLCDEEFLTL